MKKVHIDVKKVLMLICIIGTLFVFLVYKPPNENAFFYGLDLIVIWYPLTAVIYGICAAVLLRRGRAALIAAFAVFLAAAVLNTVVLDFAELPAAFVYTSIAAAAWLIAKAVYALFCEIFASWRLYKEKSEKAKQCNDIR